MKRSAILVSMALGLPAAALSAQATPVMTASTGPMVVTRDTAVVHAIAPALVEPLRFLIGRAAFKTTTGILALEFPYQEAQGPWEQLRDHLLTVTKARLPVAADSTWHWVRVEEATQDGDRLTIGFTVGNTELCPREGITAVNSDTYQASYSRLTPNGTWYLRAVAPVTQVHGMSCEVMAEAATAASPD